MGDHDTTIVMHNDAVVSRLSELPFMQDVKRWGVPLTVVSILLFSAALTQPAFYWGNGVTSSGPAGRLLLHGWRGLAGGYIEWLANPALFVSWVLALRGNRSLWVATAVSVGLMLIFLFRRTLELPDGRPGAVIVSQGAGYWLWLGSALVMIVAAWCSENLK